MKKLFLSIFLLSILSIIFSCNNINQKTKLHLGEWKIPDKPDKKGGGSLVLDEDNSITPIFDNDDDSKDYYNSKLQIKYEIDYSKNPIWIDIIFYEKGTNVEKNRVRGIVKFITNNKAECRFSDFFKNDNNRPVEFDEKTVFFDRILK